MKKYIVAFMVSMIALVDASYGATTKVRTNNTYRRVSTTQRNGPVTTNFYYNQSGRRKYGNTSDRNTTSANRSYTRDASYNSDSYGVDSYTAKSYTERKQSNYTNYSQKKSVSQERKYFLAHPFFQPLKGRFGSVTDIAYAKSSMDFDMLDGVVYDLDPTSASYYPSTGVPFDQGTINVGGKAESNQFLVKQDFSFGLTDQVAIIAMGQYDSTKWKLKDWTNGDPETKSSDTGLNVFGFGVQTRFLDASDAIGMFTVQYESQRSTADSLLADLKLGYKFDRTTLYLVGRGGYSWLKNKNSSYGFYIDDSTGDWFMLSYKRDVSDLFYAEGGLGVFSVLNKYFTVNAEAFFGNYDWHNQLTAKAAFGVQPFDSFALNIYASGVLYDSGEGKIKQFLNYDVNPVDSGGVPLATNLTYTIGDYKIKNYSEYKFGAQIILHF